MKDYKDKFNTDLMFVYQSQTKLEDSSLDKLKDKVQGNVQRLIKEQPTSVKPVEGLVSNLIDPLAQRLKQSFRNIKNRQKKKGGVLPPGYDEIKLLNPVDLSALTLSAAVSAVVSNTSRTSMYKEIGRWAELQDFERLANDYNSNLYKEKEKEARKTRSSTRNRNAFVRKALRNKGMPKVAKWHQTKLVRVGAFLFNEVMCLDGNIFVEERNGSRDIAKIALTSAAQTKLDTGLAYLERVGPQIPALLTIPNKWTSNIANCFNTRIINHTAKMVTCRSRGQTKAIEKAIIDKSMLPHIEASNIINNVPLTIDTDIHNFLDDAWFNGESFNPDYPKHDIRLTSADDYGKQHADGLPYEEWDKKLKDGFKQKRKEQRDRNVAIKSVRNQRVIDAREIKKQIIDTGNKFYNCTRDDYRGRLGFQQNINCQRDDIIRNQIAFYNKYKITDDGLFWLYVDVASNYAENKMDKAHPNLAYNWTTNNFEHLLDVFNNPDAHIDYINKADKPIGFLRSLKELAFTLDNPNYESGACAFTDASSSGLMLIAATMKCPLLGYYTNIVTTPDQEYSNDIYGHMGQIVSNILLDEDDERKLKYRDAILKFCNDTYGENQIVRKIMKRPVMTWSYGGTPHGFGVQTFDDIFEKKISKYTQNELDEHPFANDLISYDFTLFARHCADYLGRITHRAFEDTFIKAKEYMSFMRDIAGVCAAQNKQFRFTSPLGFPFEQAYVRRTKLRPIRLPLRDNIMDRLIRNTTATVAVYDEGNPIAVGKAKDGSSPNITHCLDASFMRTVINKAALHGIKDIMPIHDCWGCHPNNVSKLRDIIREEFVSMFEDNNILQQVYEQNAKALEDPSKMPDIPTKGNLDVSRILTSEFAFR